MNTLRTPVTPLLSVLMAEILGPFNVYQFFACIIWVFREYAIYSGMIVILMFLAISFELYENRVAQNRLRKKSEIKGDLEFKKKGENGEILFISEHNNRAVPGDCIKVTPGMMAPCDILITSGECLVNESVLTGESVPIYKTEIPATKHLF